MNLNSTLRTGVLLGISAIALNATFAQADEPADKDMRQAHAAIVLARASAQSANVNRQVLTSEATTAALAVALQGVMADNKLELEMRLSAHKSVFLTADL